MPKDSANDPALPTVPGSRSTLLCFSHLRWDFVYQRPQHLMSRAAAHADIFYFEEPLFVDIDQPSLREQAATRGVRVLTPLLPHGDGLEDSFQAQRRLLDEWLRQRNPLKLIVWYYTPMALLLTDHLRPDVVVYDCMDQLSAFEGAPPELVEQERRLFEVADVVFTGGRSLYEEKRGKHRRVRLFPSSVDREHFAASRNPQADPQDQADIPYPRIGFFGVIDERLDQELLRSAAECEPLWQFIMIGPVVKIDPDGLPRAHNIHYLGQKQYSDLPQYLAHWQVAMLPFAQNASTRFISPTKTPEYLAAGKPVVSTPVRDVVEPYQRLGLAHIARNSEEFCQAIRDALEPAGEGWLAEVDDFLRHTSWDQTFASMWSEVEQLQGGVRANDTNEGVTDV